MWKCIGFDSFACGFQFLLHFFSVFWFWMIFSTVLQFLIGPNAPLHYYRYWLVIAQHCPVFCAILYTYLCIHHWLIRMEYFFEYVISPWNILSTLGDISCHDRIFPDNIDAISNRKVIKIQYIQYNIFLLQLPYRRLFCRNIQW